MTVIVLYIFVSILCLAVYCAEVLPFRQYCFKISLSVNSAKEIHFSSKGSGFSEHFELYFSDGESVSIWRKCAGMDNITSANLVFSVGVSEYSVCTFFVSSAISQCDSFAEKIRERAFSQEIVYSKWTSGFAAVDLLDVDLLQLLCGAATIYGNEQKMGLSTSWKCIDGSTPIINPCNWIGIICGGREENGAVRIENVFVENLVATSNFLSFVQKTSETSAMSWETHG